MHPPCPEKRGLPGLVGGTHWDSTASPAGSSGQRGEAHEKRGVAAYDRRSLLNLTLRLKSSHLVLPSGLPTDDRRRWYARWIAAWRRRLPGRGTPQGGNDAETFYAAMCEAHPQALWIYDLATLRFLQVNDAAIAQYGYSRDEFLQMSILHVRPDPEPLQPPPTAAPGAASIWEHVCKDGRRLEVDVQGCDLVFQGRPARMVLLRDVSAEQQLKRELATAMAAEAQAHADLQQVMDRISDGFMALDAQGRFTHANQRAAQLLGLPGGTVLVGRSLDALRPTPGVSMLAERVATALRHQRPSHCEQRLAVDGPWCELRVFPSDRGVTIHLSDVSAQRKAREALRQSERQFRLLAERLPAIIYRAPADATAPCTYISPAIRQLGYTPMQWMSGAGPNWQQSLHPDDRTRVADELRTLNEAGGELHLSYRLRDHKGQWRHYIDHARAVAQPDGRIEVQGVMVEVTELRRTEQALREAEACQRGLFEAMAEGVLLFDAGQRIVESNTAMTGLSGYAQPELMRMKLPDLLRSTDGAAGQYPAEAEMRHKDGHLVPVEISQRPVREGFCVLVLRDVTERRRAEQAVREHKTELTELTERLLAQERETTRYIAQTLHEQVGQQLTVARLRLDATATMHAGAMTDALHQECRQLASSLDQAMGEVRSVLHALRPALLEEQGLVAALDNEVRTRCVDPARADVLLELDEDDLGLRWPADVEYAAFMIAREAIVDAQQRSSCTLVRVVLSGDAQSLQLEVIDDGQPAAQAGPAAPLGHLGLVGMRERAVAIGARFEVQYDPVCGRSVTLLWLKGKQ